MQQDFFGVWHDAICCAQHQKKYNSILLSATVACNIARKVSLCVWALKGGDGGRGWCLHWGGGGVMLLGIHSTWWHFSWNHIGLHSSLRSTTRFTVEQSASINRGCYMAAQRYEISLRVLKNISWVSAANEWNIFQQEKRNFTSPSGHVMFYLFCKHQ